MKKNLIGKSKIVVEPTGVCDTYEVGNWTDYYSFIKLGYKVDAYTSKIFDTSFCIKDNGVIVGYFLAYNVVNVDEKAHCHFTVANWCFMILQYRHEHTQNMG